MMRAHAEATRVASEDVAFESRVVDLSGRASFRRAVEEAGIIAKEAAHGEFVEAWVVVSMESKFVRAGSNYRMNVSAGAYFLTSSWDMTLVHLLDGH
jgi:hypothetical protein